LVAIESIQADPQNSKRNFKNFKIITCLYNIPKIKAPKRGDLAGITGRAIKLKKKTTAFWKKVRFFLLPKKFLINADKTLKKFILGEQKTGT